MPRFSPDCSEVVPSYPPPPPAEVTAMHASCSRRDGFNSGIDTVSSLPPERTRPHGHEGGYRH